MDARHEDRKAPLKRFILLASSLLLAGSISFATALPGAASAASPDRSRSEPRSFSIDARAMLGTYAAAVDGRLSAALTGLAAVAATGDAASGLWARLRGPLTTVSRQVTTNAAIRVRETLAWAAGDMAFETASVRQADVDPPKPALPPYLATRW